MWTCKKIYGRNNGCILRMYMKYLSDVLKHFTKIIHDIEFRLLTHLSNIYDTKDIFST